MLIFRNFAYFQPYHLFEPFLDVSLPIAFEDQEKVAEGAAAVSLMFSCDIKPSFSKNYNNTHFFSFNVCFVLLHDSEIVCFNGNLLSLLSIMIFPLMHINAAFLFRLLLRL